MKLLGSLCIPAALILQALPATAPAQPAAPSFDCAKAAGAAEKLVCTDAGLAAMDREAARLFRLASADRTQAATLRATQRGWIKGRDECWKEDDQRTCVAASYAERIHELRQGSKAARAPAPGNPSTGPMAFHCAGLDGLVGVTYVNTGGGAAYLQWKDRGVGLLKTPGGSGARYEGPSFDGKWTFSPKGQGAQLTRPDGKALACTQEPTG